MNIIIFKRCGVWCITSANNYYNSVWDANKITACKDFAGPEDIKQYLVKYCNKSDKNIVIVK